jgi:hypothetical protein
VIYITADSAHEWGAQGVPNSILIAKPFVKAQITQAVAALLNAEASPTPAPARRNRAGGGRHLDFTGGSDTNPPNG